MSVLLGFDADVLGPMTRLVLVCACCGIDDLGNVGTNVLVYFSAWCLLEVGVLRCWGPEVLFVCVCVGCGCVCVRGSPCGLGDLVVGVQRLFFRVWVHAVFAVCFCIIYAVSALVWLLCFTVLVLLMVSVLYGSVLLVFVLFLFCLF